MSKEIGRTTPRGAGRPKRASRTAVGVAKATAKAKGKGAFGEVGKARFDAVMKAAENSGLLKEKSGRIGGRVSAALIEQAKKQTGIEGDTDLIEFALANVALTDDFAKVFKETRGKVNPTLKLGF